MPNHHVIAGILAAAALATVTSAVPANAAPQRPDTTTVTMWHTAGVWSQPTNDSTNLSTAYAGSSYPGVCWTTGKTQTFYDPPVTTDHWVKLALRAGGFGYVWGGALHGNENGNVPNHC
ncbi:hypothetical protein POF50_015835 [Streptomyces sp. SL13]|uniref:Uncharacterized protein n=1 Tax=Streptantibioticus silvisoli TaxID=2705255 RepID=A0AA90H034_9ACTN|nr:hypothetical protein [Streptantibioticus silvisoli]MDI5964502.1 hypothetical protein [Streptantibioticus silvisoli]MDI5970794.1 hypothetical protein [Streptantibioticus silvisoli]